MPWVGMVIPVLIRISTVTMALILPLVSAASGAVVMFMFLFATCCRYEKKKTEPQ